MMGSLVLYPQYRRNGRAQCLCFAYIPVGCMECQLDLVTTNLVVAYRSIKRMGSCWIGIILEEMRELEKRYSYETRRKCDRSIGRSGHNFVVIDSLLCYSDKGSI